VGLFRPYERTEKSERQRTSTVSTKPDAQPRPAAPADNGKITVRRGAAKSGPTPTRREAEIARMQRLHPSLSPKEQRKADREARFKAQQDAWDRVESSPERALLRDFIDTRWTVAEFLMPAMILIMATMMATMNNAVLSFYVSMSLWGIFIIALINIAVMWRSFKKLLAERHPGASHKGLLMYMVNRSMMLRRFRRPSPRIKRGDPV
jgi:hypothetical protein